ncbi:MAG: VOC family protein [Bacteriovoracia bacterium]
MPAITKTTLTPYLFLNGKTKEAMSFYQRAIGGELHLTTFGEMQGEACPQAHRDLVMHASLKYGDFVLFGSDGNPNEPEDPALLGAASIQLAIGAPEPELLRLFKTLSEGGQVIHALFDAPWGGKFGVLKDRYGFQWMFASHS